MPRTANVPSESHLLAEDREDEVGVRVRHVHPLLTAGTEADTEPASRAQSDQGLDRVVAGVQRVLPRVEERQQTVTPVGDAQPGAERKGTVRPGPSERGNAAERRRRTASRSRCNPSSIVVPRSGCIITRSARNAERRDHRQDGVRRAPRSSSPSCREKTSAAKRISASLANSEGWNANEPNADPARASTRP